MQRTLRKRPGRVTSNLVSTHRTKSTADKKKKSINRTGFRASVRKTSPGLRKKGRGQYSVFSYGAARYR